MPYPYPDGCTAADVDRFGGDTDLDAAAAELDGECCPECDEEACDKHGLNIRAAKKFANEELRGSGFEVLARLIRW